MESLLLHMATCFECIKFTQLHVHVQVIFIIVSEEDAGGKYAEVMMKYFLAEGVVSDHALSVVSANHDPQQLLRVSVLFACCQLLTLKLNLGDHVTKYEN